MQPLLLPSFCSFVPLRFGLFVFSPGDDDDVAYSCVLLCLIVTFRIALVEYSDHVSRRAC